ncbi:MAG TPA: ubiquinol oxidase subunit II [Methylomirabilota bacterium]|nr:ubiquinol oxidase subunit II [Methylomirabilota bacterium]
MKYKLIILVLLIVDFVLLLKIVIAKNSFLLLTPQGIIASQEKNLMITTIGLMFLIVIPVFIFTFFTAWKYREKNTKAKYTPDWDHENKLQALWWGAPFVIIVILSVLNWKTAHQLDPHKSIISSVKPMTIQVVALRWKWLFIYPEQKIATVNWVAFPEKTPINFELTADAPMNSFWIPQLGGQMYAMTGMVTPLRLIAGTTGEFPGSTAELSGQGFAGMRFLAKSLSQNDFDAWVSSVKQSHQILNFKTYKVLAKPSEDNKPTFYSSTEDRLYTTIIKQFMAPQTIDSGQETQMMPGMKM